MAMNFDLTRDCLNQFDFKRLFIEELGWSRPSRKIPFDIIVKDDRFVCRHVAELAGAVVLEVESPDGSIPDAKSRTSVYKEVAKLHHENLLIFVDRERTQSLWYWVKRHDGKQYSRDHLFLKGQPGDLFIGKLSQIVFDLADFDAEGNVSIVEVAQRLRSALDIERVTKKFFRDFSEQHIEFLKLIHGINDDRQKRWYASVLLNRLMFIYFLQKKSTGFLDGGNLNYLRDKLEESKRRGKNRYYSEFLQALFFEGFAKPEGKRSAEAKKLLGTIKYLNGGLFLRHRIEQENPQIKISDQAFENLYDLFERYTWHLDDTPGGQDNDINPDVLGYIFEKYINQKAFGAYYTRTEITEYLCERTIHRLILDAVNNTEAMQGQEIAGLKVRAYSTLGDLLLDLDITLCKRLLHEVLPGLSLLDPACGSGAFLVAAMKTLINVYSAIIGRIKFLNDKNLTSWLADIEKIHPSVGYYIKKRIITDNLYGVDVMEEATEIAKLRLFLTLVSSAQTVDDLEPLPNIDFSILSGNSLIGLMRVTDEDFESRKHQGGLFRKKYKDVLEEKNRLIENYRHATGYTEDLMSIRDEIDAKKREAYESLNDILFEEFRGLGIKFERATWNDKKNDAGKPEKRQLRVADVEAQNPFHWGYEFDEILNKRGGFDAIITNPPWEIFKPNGKEFFETYSDVVTKKSMTIHDFEKEQEELLKDQDIRGAWLDYLSQFPHISSYFRSASQYRNQVSVVNGKKSGTDINLYKLFVEQSFNLLKQGGKCGIVIPSGIYSDLGATQLRNLLFSKSQISSLFGFSNERYLFEGVHHSFKICILSFSKGGSTLRFPAAFRINPREAVGADQLDRIFHTQTEQVQISTEVVRRLSPDSLSVMEFRSDLDMQIAEKMLCFPLLGEAREGEWNARFTAEFHMTNDSHLFQRTYNKGLVPLFEGKMIHQFESKLSKPRYWLDMDEARKALLGRHADQGQRLGYETYRIAYRSIARGTDSRTMIATVLPRFVFCGHSLNVSQGIVDESTIVYLSAMLDSLVLDYSLRLRVAANLTLFFIYQLPVPRIGPGNDKFHAVVYRAAQLLCTTPEFDDLAKQVGLKSHLQGVTDALRRAQLRAELDGLIAHLYGLTESEFVHILGTFPLVSDPAKVAAQNAYRDVERGLIK